VVYKCFISTVLSVRRGSFTCISALPLGKQTSYLKYWQKMSKQELVLLSTPPSSSREPWNHSSFLGSEDLLKIHITVPWRPP